MTQPNSPFQSASPAHPPSWAWMRANLFDSWTNSLLTLVCLGGMLWIGIALLSWIVTEADWAVIGANLRLFLVGRFPVRLLWRLWLVLGITAGLVGLTWGQSVHRVSRFTFLGMGLLAGATIALALAVGGGFSSALWLLAVWGLAGGGLWLGQRFRAKNLRFPLPLLWGLAVLANLWLMGGGWGLRSVSTSLWNGLLLTLLTSVISIALSFPLGVLLALGRQSPLPVVRWLSIVYIELVRGLPLIGILFIAQVMFPLVLPSEVRLDRVLRAIAGLTLFSAAYLAETVRGGLQSIPRGQIEAAQALGLNPLLVNGLVVLPQALRAVIPALVGQFIGLFKDTSLLSLFALVELTGIARSILSQPQFLGRYAEVYLFIGVIYWLFCYGMSVGSHRLEQRLRVGKH